MSNNCKLALLTARNFAGNSSKFHFLGSLKMIFAFFYLLFYSTAANKMLKCKAKQMAERDAELAAVLFSRQEKSTKDDQPVRESDAVRKR